MSRTTKALAILGVVAGLGVAALPMSSYAAPEDVTGSVKVKTTIDDTLTMTVTGNDDGHTVDAAESASHVVLLSTSDVTGKILNGGNGSGAATVNVTTNNLKGYSVSLKGATTELVGTTNNSEKIPSIGSAAAAIATSGDSEWGYKVTTNDANFTAEAGPITAATATGKKILENYQPVTIAGAVIINNGAATASAGDTFTLTFGVHASESQAADTYTNTVTLTAAANNA